MARECRKCGEIIPNNIVVDGKAKTLQNRKFCLKCSPYRAGNNCSIAPFVKKGRTWKEYTEKQKACVKMSLYRRALRVREELYQKLGGKCSKCGYDKCKRALSFHHKDPSQKRFGLTLNKLWSKNRALIDEEAEKCILLCLNCHTELEDEISRKTSIVSSVNEKYGTNY